MEGQEIPSGTCESPDTYGEQKRRRTEEWVAAQAAFNIDAVEEYRAHQGLKTNLDIFGAAASNSHYEDVRTVSRSSSSEAL
jgi:hypothetical protein